MEPANIPGIVNGKMTLRNVLGLVAPRSLAASSSDVSSFSIEEYSGSTANGRSSYTIPSNVAPSVYNNSNVFAKYAAVTLFDELYEVHVKDGGNLSIPGGDPDGITFGFNVWTVLDEVMNPNVEYDADRGGFIVDKPFAGQETFLMPEGVGANTLVKVEHEEVVTLPRYLKQYGLKKATFKIALDENLITALKVLDKLGLRSIHPVKVGDVKVVPRDVVAACAPQPKDIGDEMKGMMLVGIHCIGVKDGKRKECFIYQPFDNQMSMEQWGSQAVVAQTGFGAALSIELVGRGIWKESGVYSPEHFDPKPYLELMDESGFVWKVLEI